MSFEVHILNTVEVISQIIGIIAMAFAILSYQRKTGKGALIFQLICGLLFSIHMFMLNAIGGALLNMIASVRAILFLNKAKLKSDNNIWLIGFISVYIASYIMTFTVFDMPMTVWNTIIEILPVIGMTASTLGLRCSETAKIRKFGLISSPVWLAYNIVNGSIGGTVCETLSLCSIIIGIVRFDINQTERKREK